jgi:hypothetical protein
MIARKDISVFTDEAFDVFLAHLEAMKDAT